MNCVVNKVSKQKNAKKGGEEGRRKVKVESAVSLLNLETQILKFSNFAFCTCPNLGS